jgi:hypothetical protein
MPVIVILLGAIPTTVFAQNATIVPNANLTYANCLARYGQVVNNQHGQAITICSKEAYPWLTNTSSSPEQSSTVTTNAGVCNSAVCDNSQFKEFAFDKDINLLNIHIHKHSGVWHNERGVFVPWSALCNQGQSYLVQSCSDLIDSSGTLTQAGDRAVNCITNGAIITIAANTLQLPLSIVKGALGYLAPMTGCDGIVNLNTIQTGPQVQSLLNALSNAASGGQ